MSFRFLCEKYSFLKTLQFIFISNAYIYIYQTKKNPNPDAENALVLLNTHRAHAYRLPYI